MRSSIIIPTLNEDKNIVPCINSIVANFEKKDDRDVYDIIVVDGGSKDNTLEEVAGLKNKINTRVLQLEKANIAYQLNRGALIAEGDVLIFLHADCRLQENSLNEIKEVFKRIPDLIGGAFTMKVKGKRFFYRILSVGGNIYCRFSKIYFGDRVVFIKRKIFRKMSGFREFPVMSDYDFSQRMKKEGKVCLVKGPVISSGRKFEDEPFYRIFYLIFWSIGSFKRGIDPEVIKRKYYRI
jgi:rSAM/selenodomain-associated transferase 2